MLKIHQRHRRTDGRTTYDSNTALAVRASRGKTYKSNTIQSRYKTIYKSYEYDPMAVLPGWHGVAEATPKKPRATPQATPNENMNFGT